MLDPRGPLGVQLSVRPSVRNKNFNQWKSTTWISYMTFPCDMVDMEMVDTDMEVMDMVDMDMVDMDMVDNDINLGCLP